MQRADDVEQFLLSLMMLWQKTAASKSFLNASKVKLSSDWVHELAQPITAISAYISGCVFRLKQNKITADEMIDVLQRMENKINYAGKIIEDMQNFIADGVVEYRQSCINQVAKESSN